MSERTHLVVVPPISEPCLDCLGPLTPGLAGQRCSRCLAAVMVEGMTRLWSPEDRACLARVIDVVNMTTPVEDVPLWWTVLGEVAAERH